MIKSKRRGNSSYFYPEKLNIYSNMDDNYEISRF